MKIKSITIQNIGKHSYTEIPVDKPLLLFYGDLETGKTTILNCFRWALGCKYPDDLIRHGETEASVLIELDTGSVSRSWYVARDKTTKARPVQFIRDGKPVPKPDVEIKKLLNPFLLDNEYLLSMNERQRGDYFVETFPTDTADLDTQAADCAARAKELRAAIKGYGEIDLTEQKPVDVAALTEHLEAAGDRNRENEARLNRVELLRQAVENVKAEGNTIETIWRTDRTAADVRLAALKQQVKDLENEIEGATITLNQNLADKREEHDAAITAHEEARAVAEKLEDIDLAPIHEAIAEASAQNVRAAQYDANLVRDAHKGADTLAVKGIEAQLRDIKTTKIAMLAEASKSIGIPGLAFDEAGAMIYEGTAAGMLSTSQVMRLSSALSGLYPAGFGLELVDRAESLGKSIFGFIDRAKAEEKTILATIVGESPAEIPENVGVFVVQDGTVTKE